MKALKEKIVLTILSFNLRLIVIKINGFLGISLNCTKLGWGLTHQFSINRLSVMKYFIYCHHNPSSLYGLNPELQN